MRKITKTANHERNILVRGSRCDEWDRCPALWT